MFPWGVLRPTEKQGRPTPVYEVLLSDTGSLTGQYVTRLSLREHQTSDYTYYPVLSCIDRDDVGRSAESRGSHADAKDNSGEEIQSYIMQKELEII